MILNIRGTHGSGKSTLVKGLLEKYDNVMLNPSPRGKPEAYKVSVNGLAKPIFVIGPYHTACGGCDAVQPYDTIWPLVEKYARLGHVIFEGALISVSVGSIGLAMAARKKDCVVAYLDTPIEVCLDRIKQRRAEKGNNTPLDPKNTISKHTATERTRAKMEALGVRCVVLNHKKASYKQILKELQR